LNHPVTVPYEYGGVVDVSAAADEGTSSPAPVLLPLHSPGGPGLLLVFGPEGSGKSIMLRDIAKAMTEQQQQQQQQQQQEAGHMTREGLGREVQVEEETRENWTQQQQQVEYWGGVMVVEHKGDVGGGGPGPHR
jgi:hypothetical protein